MLMNAETKEKRKLRLEHFFREAYALTFGLKPGEKRKFEEVTSDVIMVTYSDYYYFLIRKNSNAIIFFCPGNEDHLIQEGVCQRFGYERL
jgi:hypothetical protein